MTAPERCSAMISDDGWHWFGCSRKATRHLRHRGASRGFCAQHASKALRTGVWLMVQGHRAHEPASGFEAITTGGRKVCEAAVQQPRETWAAGESYRNCAVRASIDLPVLPPLWGQHDTGRRTARLCQRHNLIALTQGVRLINADDDGRPTTFYPKSMFGPPTTRVAP